MKLVSYLREEHDQLAFLVDGYLYDCDLLHPDLPSSMNMFLHYWEDLIPIAKQVDAAIKEGKVSTDKGIAITEVALLAPVPFPTSYRKHVSKTTEFSFPDFVFGNQHSIQGAGKINCMPDHLLDLDFEVTIAAVICKHTRNITAAEADEYIGGLMIMNDFTAGKFVQQESTNNTAVVKAKDFSTASGPCLVTLDELESLAISAVNNHIGKNWSFACKCLVNGVELINENITITDFTFAELIERCAYGVTLQPGDIIAIGFENKGSLRAYNMQQNNTAQSLQENDIVEIEIEGLGKLSNIIVKENSDFSILN
jgi:fumarylacetoacetate (FAA) hydrolase